MIFRQEWSPSSSESRIWILPFFEGDHLSPFYWSFRITPMLITPGSRQDGGDECVWWQSSSGQGGERCQRHDQCSSLLPQALEPVIIQGRLFNYIYLHRIITIMIVTRLAVSTGAPAVLSSSWPPPAGRGHPRRRGTCWHSAPCLSSSIISKLCDIVGHTGTKNLLKALFLTEG